MEKDFSHPIFFGRVGHLGNPKSMNTGGRTRRAALRLLSGVLPVVISSAARASNVGTLRTVTVSSGPGLETALANARPGDWIELTATGLTGSFVLNASGTESHPIVITSQTGWGGGVNSTLTVNGAHITIYKMRTSRLSIYGSHCRVSRNYITAPVTVFRGGFDLTFEYNDVTGTGPGLNIRMSAAADRPYGAWVHHNYCHNRSGAGTGTDRQAICYANGSQEGGFADHSGLVEYNLVEKWDASWAFSSKTTGVVWQFNTCRNCHRGMESRIGNYNDWIANTSINSNLNKIHGRGHRLIGNYVDRVTPSSTQGWVLMAGSVHADDYLAPGTSYPQWQNAKDCLVTGCTGALTIGGRTSSGWNVYADGNTLENHAGNVAIDTYQTNTTDKRTAPSSAELPAYVTLTSADVGPLSDV
jgi:hypothetical protein